MIKNNLKYGEYSLLYKHILSALELNASLWSFLMTNHF